MNHDSYDFKIDCWGVGCVLYALLYGSPPFNDKIKQNIVQNVKHSQLIFPDYASIEAKKLLKSLLNKDSTLRIDMKGIINFIINILMRKFFLC